ncbi:hypothetical protein ACHAPJ_008190 [Fusarium lateritium]
MDMDMDMDMDERVITTMDGLLEEQSLLGEHLLLLAACNFQVELFKLVLEKPENRIGLNHIMAAHESLSQAIDYNMEEIVKALTSLPRSEFDFCNTMEPDPWHLNRAALVGRLSMFKILLDTGRYDITERDGRGWTPLFYAAFANAGSIVKFLLQDADVKADEKDNTGRTPLSYAAEQGGELVSIMLLELDEVDPNSQDLEGKTPFYYALRYGQNRIA